ncbi:DoxX family protein [Luteolibacter sp. AS25]|uniref:DoxX family protein n=1 Tax=Luteolibacter sp. AS25 TaxID=3135776 RepID=UPI00398B4FC6
MNPRNHQIAALILRVAMGAWFVTAGGMKIFATGLDRFVVDIENYQLVSHDLAVITAYLIPWLEVVAGICFMLGVLRKGAWLAMVGLVLAFSISVGSAWARGLDISCGCLGGTEKISYWRKVIEFALYYVVLAYIAYVEWRTPGTPAIDSE